MTTAALEALARARGLADSYHDYRGEFRKFSPAAKQAILAAMGIDVRNSNAIAEAADAHTAAEWTALLQPVYVRVESSLIEVDVSVPSDAAALSMHWRVLCEDGTEHTGTKRVAELHEVDRTTINGRTYVRRSIALPSAMGLGYHRLSVALDGGVAAEASLIVTPERCYEPTRLADGGKVWGLAVQLYTLRSDSNWGIGDFGDLRELIAESAELGCDVIGLNPLHALMPANPGHISPYSPSSRQFFNVLYIDVPRVPEFEESQNARDYVAQEQVQARLAKLRSTWNVDYQGVANLKFTVLKLLYAHFRAVHIAGDTERARAFHHYIEERGPLLKCHAVFDTLDLHFRKLGPQYWGWPSWPQEELQDPRSPAVQQFAADRAHEVEFFCYLQWIAATQLAEVQTVARERGMGVGVYGDVAVGVSPGGSETWSNRTLYLQGASIGAPPDPLALKGQDWGIPPQDPMQLYAQRYEPFVALLRNNMRAVGALRLDHVMALCRLWWVPRGFTSTDGVYVHYPLEDLMRILALESVRNRCLVIGEDLGTVPDEMREAMERFGVYHYNVLLFEKEQDGRFKSPERYLSRALASVTTHDLPPLRSWWEGLDIELRDRLHVYPSTEVRDRELEQRKVDRRALLQAAADVGLWHWRPDDPVPTYSHALMRALHLYLSLSAATLEVAQIEDLIGMTDPVNVPGTDKEHPNWQRKVAATLHEVFGDAEVRETLLAMGKARRGENPNA